jgi:hypothetical protein
MKPCNSRSVRSAMSSCRNRTRNAEHRCPALLNADFTVSSTTCSGSAELSTSMAFWPPVSAISVAIAVSRAASIRLMMRATSVDPVKATPARRGSGRSASPSAGPLPGSRWSTSPGTPAA